MTARAQRPMFAALPQVVDDSHDDEDSDCVAGSESS